MGASNRQLGPRDFPREHITVIRASSALLSFLVSLPKLCATSFPRFSSESRAALPAVASQICNPGCLSLTRVEIQEGFYLPCFLLPDINLHFFTGVCICCRYLHHLQAPQKQPKSKQGLYIRHFKSCAHSSLLNLHNHHLS